MRQRLGQIRCPTLIIHGALDRVCPVSNAWRVAIQLGTKDVRVVILPRSQHIITRDVEHADVVLLQETTEVEVLRRAWTGERFSFQGRIYSYDRVKITPPPAQQPGPPIYLGGFTDRAVRREKRAFATGPRRTSRRGLHRPPSGPRRRTRGPGRGEPG